MFDLSEDVETCSHFVKKHQDAMPLFDIKTFKAVGPYYLTCCGCGLQLDAEEWEKLNKEKV